MVLFTLIVRASDGLYLSAFVEEDRGASNLESYRRKSKMIISQSVASLSKDPFFVDDSPYYFLSVPFLLLSFSPTSISPGSLSLS